jgi:hypothetical protein
MLVKFKLEHRKRILSDIWQVLSFLPPSLTFIELLSIQPLLLSIGGVF